MNTENSDIDYRGIFINTEVSKIVGLDRFEHKQSQTDKTDEVYTEFVNALKLLRSGNTQMVEALYHDDWLEISEEWREVQKHRSNLLSSETLFNCLKGYIQSELKLANGERTGKLGGKRKEQIDRYGFSPKNFVQLFRLAWAGATYFRYGYFPVNVFKDDPSFGEYLMKIKTRPHLFTKEQLNSEAKLFELKLIHEFEHRKVNTEFNQDLANNLCLKVYYPILSAPSNWMD